MKDKVIIIDSELLPELAKLLFSEIEKLILDENKKNKPYLSTKQLSEMYPYGQQYFREKINAGAFGKKDRNGTCMAKADEVEKYLFDYKG